VNQDKKKPEAWKIPITKFHLQNEDRDDWLTCGFINYTHQKNCEIKFHKLPFLVELSSQYTTYSLHVAMSLKGKWSQRMYEL
jgi:hypothetical protein